MKFYTKLMIFIAILLMSGCGDDPDPNSTENTPAIKNSIPRLLPEISNIASLAKSLNLAKNTTNYRYAPRKIAILDNGFAGYQDAIGKTLPHKTKYITIKGSQPKASSHGLIMAEQFVGLIRESLGRDSDPQLYLIVSNGYFSMSEAVDKAIEAGVEMILYAQVWEYSLGVSDIVRKATDRGIIWVNASGNFHRRIYVGPAKSQAQNPRQFDLPHQGYLEFEVLKQSQPVKITYSWFSPNSDSSSQDVNLHLYDSQKKRILSSVQKRQIVYNEQQESITVPMKYTTPTLTPGKYYIALENKSQNFGDQDKIKISLDALDVAISSGGFIANSIQAPATDQNVLCVSANDYQYASNNTDPQKGRVPDIYVPSLITLGSGANQIQIRSTSTAAAAAAAKIYIISQIKNSPRMSRSEFMKYF